MRQCPDCGNFEGLHSDGCPNDPGEIEYDFNASEDFEEGDYPGSQPLHDEQEEQEHNLVSIRGILMMRGEP